MDAVSEREAPYDIDDWTVDKLSRSMGRLKHS